MVDSDAGVFRRGFLRATAGGAAVATATGAATAQETATPTDDDTAEGGEQRPDFDGYLDDVQNLTEVVDARGQEEVTVDVGAGPDGLQFDPPAVHVDNGATVVWEWTGEGGAHNVVAQDDTFNSGDPVAEAGTTFEFTFEEDGVYTYLCVPHEAIGMKGAVVVGEEYPTTTDPLPNQDADEGTDTPEEGEGDGDQAGDGGDGGAGGGEPDFGGYLDGANGYEGEVADETGAEEVTVAVGAGDTGLAFDPPAVHVDNGATVVWEWTGEGGGHNVVGDDGTFESGDPVAEAGATFEYTFEEDGVYNYYCAPHEGAGMLGSIVVGTDYPTAGGGGEGGGDGGGEAALPASARDIGVASSFAMAATLGFAYIFIKYGGDYETPE